LNKQTLKQVWDGIKKNESVIKILNNDRMKKIANSKVGKLVGSHPYIALGGACGLGIWLSSRSHRSKTFNQGG